MAPKKTKKKTVLKHKPSTKRTLEDILSSLQDLAKNELSDADLQLRTGEDEDHKKGQPEEITLQAMPEPGPDIDEQIHTDAPEPNSELVSGETGDIFEGLDLLPEDQLGTGPDAGQKGNTTDEEEVIRWEDIPVLEDVADDPGDRDNNTTLDAKAESRDTDTEFQVPDPKLARKIAIQVAARLNIEMHKQGLDGLDIATINRLRALLVKELAKAATNNENDET